MSAESSRAVFLSYASQDAEAARKICAALRAAGVEVWFDQSELVGGDAWDAKIRRQIKDCALFVPVISANTQARLEGYFRLEWKLAAQRTHTMAEAKPFLLPVVIDVTRDSDAHVPEEFRAVQWTRGPGGEGTPAFCARVKQLLDGEPPLGARTSPRASVRTADEDVRALQGKKIRPSRVAALGTLAAVVALLVWQPWKTPTALVAGQSPVSSAADKSIAVLPFENQSDDKENTAFFSDGMHEDILTSLANIRDLRVISRTSVMEYRGTTKKIPQIARELGVAFILEGSVRRTGSQVRITGQLIRAANDEHLWAKRYDRELTPKEMFAIQANLATEIAAALRAVIAPDTKKLLERRPTEILAAYDLYLKGRTDSGTSSQQLRENEQFLLEAVALDPNFGEAWGALAVTHASHVFWDYDRTPQRLASADAAIAQAVRLAPDSPEVMLSLGHYALRGYRDYTRATEQFERVVRLQPNNSDAFTSLGFLRRRQGLWLEALQNFRKAAELDPANERGQDMLSSTLQGGRRWPEAIAAHRRAIELRPDQLYRQLALARTIFQATGSTKEADELVAGLLPEVFESQQLIRERKYWAGIKGDYSEWKRLDARQAEESQDDLSRWSRSLADAMTLAAYGEIAEARARLGNSTAEIRSTLERQPTNARLWSVFGMMEALLDQREAALHAAHKAVELLPETIDATGGSVQSRALAVVYAWTGQKDLAITELSRLLRFPSIFNYQSSVHTLRVDPAFAPLRGDARFEALLKDPKNHVPLF